MKFGGKQMKKKDLLVMLGIVVIAGVLYFGLKLINEFSNKEEERFGYVYYRNQIILAFDIDIDKVYDFDGS